MKGIVNKLTNRIRISSVISVPVVLCLIMVFSIVSEEEKPNSLDSNMSSGEGNDANLLSIFAKNGIKTGDYNVIMLLLIAVVIAIATIIGIIVYNRRKDC